MEKYKVLIASSAARELEPVDGKAMRQRVAEAIVELAADPRHHGVEKLSGSRDRYRVRVGDFRVVYAINEATRVVDVVKIGHRREIYR
ncbi:MAG TPA: type II toxin-antitoxin system RelE/ParE family toxin [Usitatibacter sp.]|nr:type II toxin-antitoxin system RelE/ParE family toxin [Usitatibacter sp.]